MFCLNKGCHQNELVSSLNDCLGWGNTLLTSRKWEKDAGKWQGLTAYDPNDNDVPDDRNPDYEREQQGPEYLRCAAHWIENSESQEENIISNYQ